MDSDSEIAAAIRELAEVIRESTEILVEALAKRDEAEEEECL